MKAVFEPGRVQILICLLHIPTVWLKACKLPPCTEQKIQLLDGDIIGIARSSLNVYSCRFKNEDLGYLGGCFAGLLTKSDLPYTNEDLKVGLIFTDIYPAWTNYIQPAFENGAKSIDPQIEVVFSVVELGESSERGRSCQGSVFPGS